MNWKQIILDLEESGMSLYKIGLAVGLQRGQVVAIKEGREPKHSTGMKLISLHRGIGTDIPISSFAMFT